MHICNWKLIFKFRYFLIEGAYNKIRNLFSELRHKFLGMVTEHNITLYITGGPSKYLHGFNIGQCAIHGNLWNRSVLCLGLLQLFQQIGWHLCATSHHFLLYHYGGFWCLLVFLVFNVMRCKLLYYLAWNLFVVWSYIQTCYIECCTTIF